MSQRVGARLGAVPVAYLCVFVFMVALANRLVPVLRGAGLSGVISYDDGVYYAGAVGVVHGQLPYRDFLFLHPPGILVALAPVAAAGRWLGESSGWEVSRLVWMVSGSLASVVVLAILLPLGQAPRHGRRLCVRGLSRRRPGRTDHLLRRPRQPLSGRGPAAGDQRGRGEAARAWPAASRVDCSPPRRRPPRLRHDGQDLGSGAAGGGVRLRRRRVGPPPRPGRCRGRRGGDHGRLPAVLPGCPGRDVADGRPRSGRSRSRDCLHAAVRADRDDGTSSPKEGSPPSS